MNSNYMSTLPQLVLGTAQLGLNYGIANTTGMPTDDQSKLILREAIDNGVKTIDTARAYGCSEERIGRFVNCSDDVTVITKLSPLEKLSCTESQDAVIEATIESLQHSRKALQRNQLQVVMIHRAQHLTQFDGVIWKVLKNEQDCGRIGKLGVSVQTPSEAIFCLQSLDINHIQLPFNLLDYRWEEAGLLQELQRRPDVTVHVRSVLLQGLLSCSPDTPWPDIEGLQSNLIKERLHMLAKRCERSNPTDLCISFARATKWIDGIVLGVENVFQLKKNIDLFSRLPLTNDQKKLCIKEIPRCNTRLLDPTKWSR